MKRNLFSGLVAAVLVMSFVSGALAFGKMAPGQRADKGGQGFMKDKIAKEIGLTQQQKEAFLKKEQQLEKEILGLRQDNQKMRLWMRQELKKDSPDKGAVNRTIEKIGGNNTNIQKKRTEYIIWMRNQLTPEQREKLNACFEQKGPRTDRSGRKVRGK
jgi:Spy/CpxP family protein refolding chaperone